MKKIPQHLNVDNYTWQRICAFYDNKCLACKNSFSAESLTIDHVKPVAMGGRNSIRNYQPLCMGCNRNKGGRITIDYRWDKGKCLLDYLRGGPSVTQFSLDDVDIMEDRSISVTMEQLVTELQPFAEAMNIIGEQFVAIRNIVEELSDRIELIETYKIPYYSEEAKKKISEASPKSQWAMRKRQNNED